MSAQIMLSADDIPDNNDAPIIILCEQTWNHKGETRCSFNSLQGIAYAKYLRRVKKRNPIVFVSFLSANQLLGKPNTRIITAIGHGYLQIPYTEAELQNVINTTKPLHEIQLSDVIINFCQPRGVVTESFHVFKPKLRAIKASSLSEEQKRIRYEAEFQNYEQELLKDTADYPQIIAEFKRLVGEYRRTSLIERITDVVEEQFSRFLPSEDDKNETFVTTAKPWKILFLDDRPEELQDIFQEIDHRKIGYDVVTSSAEAKDVIEKDIFNQYAVIVSDYRLFEPNSNWKESRMQPEQGYDFLLWLSSKTRFNGMIALSGLSKWFLMESFRKHQVNVKVYSKNNVLTDSGARLFVDDLEYLGDKEFEVLCNQPKAKVWHDDKTESSGKIVNFALKPYYVYHRNHPSYESVEQELNSIAEKVAREIEYTLDDKANTFAPIISTKGNALTNMKGKLEDEYETFQLKLLYRRIFYYLILKGFHRDAISRLLHKGDTDSEKGMSEQLIKQIPYYLGIQSEGDIPYRLLIEEVYFLQHYMSLPLYEAAKMMDQTYVIFNDYINRYLSKQPEVEELTRYICRGDVKAVSINETHVILNHIVAKLEPRIAKNLIDDIQEVITLVAKSLSKFKLLEDSVQKIDKLQVKISTKLSKS